jgi:hypothetical protein
MSDIEHTTKAFMQFAPEAKSIQTFGGSFNAPPIASKSDLVTGQPERPCKKATAFIAKPGPSGGRPPLFRR